MAAPLRVIVWSTGTVGRHAIRGIDAVSRHLAAHFPRRGGGNNELPDAPVVM
jgi:uncharacterized membrane protein